MSLTHTETNPVPQDQQAPSVTGVRLWSVMLSNPLRYCFSAWPFRALGYLAGSIILVPIITAALVVLIPFAALIPVLGIPLAALERPRLRLAGGPPLRSAHAKVPKGGGRMRVRLSERATWRELLLVPIVLSFGALGLIAIFVGVVFVGAGVVAIVHLINPGTFRAANPPEAALGALIVLVSAPYIVGLIAGAQASVTLMVLHPRQRELAKQLAKVRISRAELSQAFEAERRRIERELHDGVQSHLVTVSMRLGVAELELERAEDQLLLKEAATETSRAQVAQAVARTRADLRAAYEATEASMSSLRATVRGIYPSVLTDRGIGPALKELAGRVGPEVRVTLGTLARYSPTFESLAYFTASEAITNVAKYAPGAVVEVSCMERDSVLFLEVLDNGPGGANPHRGSGLRGLMQRAELVDGKLTVDSPRGGPTAIRLQIPAAWTTEDQAQRRERAHR